MCEWRSTHHTTRLPECSWILSETHTTIWQTLRAKMVIRVLMSYRLIATLSISGELIVSRYVAGSITTDCRAFGPHRPLSTSYTTVLYTVDQSLHCQSVLQSVVNWICYICSRSVCIIWYIIQIQCRHQVHSPYIMNGLSAVYSILVPVPRMIRSIRKNNNSVITRVT